MLNPTINSIIDRIIIKNTITASNIRTNTGLAPGVNIEFMIV
jgi:hypothetical protein